MVRLNQHRYVDCPILCLIISYPRSIFVYAKVQKNTGIFSSIFYEIKVDKERCFMNKITSNGVKINLNGRNRPDKGNEGVKQLKDSHLYHEAYFEQSQRNPNYQGLGLGFGRKHLPKTISSLLPEQPVCRSEDFLFPAPEI